jgi:hypothetical protein
MICNQTSLPYTTRVTMHDAAVHSLAPATALARHGTTYAPARSKSMRFSITRTTTISTSCNIHTHPKHAQLPLLLPACTHETCLKPLKGRLQYQPCRTQMHRPAVRMLLRRALQARCSPTSLSCMLLCNPPSSMLRYSTPLTRAALPRTVKHAAQCRQEPCSMLLFRAFKGSILTHAALLVPSC